MISKLDGEVEGPEMKSCESEVVKLKTTVGEGMKAESAKLKNCKVEERTVEGHEVERAELIKTAALKT